MQALTLMNSPFVNRRVRAEGGSLVERLIKSSQSNEEIVEQLYLSTLSRRPEPGERELAVSWLNQDRSAAEDLHWALLNKLDFILNY
jgi:hypothetical protein